MVGGRIFFICIIIVITRARRRRWLHAWDHLPQFGGRTKKCHSRPTCLDGNGRATIGRSPGIAPNSLPCDIIHLDHVAQYALQEFIKIAPLFHCIRRHARKISDVAHKRIIAIGGTSSSHVVPTIGQTPGQDVGIDAQHSIPITHGPSPERDQVVKPVLAGRGHHPLHLAHEAGRRAVAAAPAAAVLGRDAAADGNDGRRGLDDDAARRIEHPAGVPAELGLDLAVDPVG